MRFTAQLQLTLKNAVKNPYSCCVKSSVGDSDKDKDLEPRTPVTVNLGNGNMEGGYFSGSIHQFQNQLLVLRQWNMVE